MAITGQAQVPSRQLFDAFREVLINRCLLPGSFFIDDGMDTLVDSVIQRLEHISDKPNAVLGTPVRSHMLHTAAG